MLYSYSSFTSLLSMKIPEDKCIIDTIRRVNTTLISSSRIFYFLSFFCLSCMCRKVLFINEKKELAIRHNQVLDFYEEEGFVPEEVDLLFSRAMNLFSDIKQRFERVLQTKLEEQCKEDATTKSEMEYKLFKRHLQKDDWFQRCIKDIYSYMRYGTKPTIIPLSDEEIRTIIRAMPIFITGTTEFTSDLTVFFLFDERDKQICKDTMFVNEEQI